jgi:large subunit ribosomal protein L9
MKVILTQDIKSLGKRGDLKDVSEGYARNFLFPKKMAEVATTKALEKASNEKEIAANKLKEALNAAKEEAKKLEGIRVIIKTKTSKGKLFGSIGQKEIANKLKEKKVNISEEDIIIAEPIKTLGEKEVTLKIHPEVSVKIKLSVEEEKK